MPHCPGGQPTNNSGSVQDLQQEFQKKQLLLRQVQQQKANLFGQSQRLQQQLMDASKPQQTQQLQKQQTILQQLNQQFEQQQSILQSEIQCQAILLHQRQQQPSSNQVLRKEAVLNSRDSKVGGDLGDLKGKLGNPNEKGKRVKVSSKKAKANASSTSGPGKKSAAKASTKASKRSSKVAEEGELRPPKIAKISRGGLSTQKNGAKSDNQTKTLTDIAGATSNLSSTVAKKSSSGSTASSEKGVSSLTNSMPIPAIGQHPESLDSCGQLTPRCIARKCLPLVKHLINHEDGWVFRDAVDPVELGIPDYFDVVENPMDLTLVVNKLEDGAYKDAVSFEMDTKLVFKNAILFNGEESDVGQMAKRLMATFAEDFKSTMKDEGL